MNIGSLGYFNINDETLLYTDASPVGLGAVLVQKRDNEEIVIAHAAKSLTDTEKRYPQTQREAYAAVWGVERFYFYLYGRKFTLRTDYRALQFIFKKEIPTNKRACSRAESWALRLQAYSFDVEYIKGEKNIADSFSRLACNQYEKFNEDHEIFINAIQVNKDEMEKFISIQEMIAETEKDDELKQVMKALDSHNWSGVSNPIFKALRKNFYHDSKLVYKEYQTVLPKSLRPQALKLMHSSHSGIVVTKRRLRALVWWPNMGKDVEKLLKTCPACQLVGKPNNQEPLRMKDTPTDPWEEVAIDHFDIPGKLKLLVLTDYTSRYVSARVVKDETAETTIQHLEEIFGIWYYPKRLRSDNAKVFESQLIKKYCTDHNILPVFTPPLNPQSNGEVEKQNESILKTLRIAHLENKSLAGALKAYLRDYNATPHSVTGMAPYKMMTSREPRTKIETNKESPWTVEEALEKNKLEKFKTQEYVNKKRRTAEADIEPGDSVIVQNLKPTSKLQPRFLNKKFKVIDKVRNEVLIQAEDGTKYRRATHHVKRWHSPEKHEENPLSMTSNPDQVNSELDKDIIFPGIDTEPDQELGLTSRADRIPNNSIRRAGAATRTSTRNRTSTKRLIESCNVELDKDSGVF